MTSDLCFVPFHIPETPFIRFIIGLHVANPLSFQNRPCCNYFWFSGFLFLAQLRLELLVGIAGCLLLGTKTVVLIDINRLPRVADPDITDSTGRVVTAAVVHVVGENTLLGLVLVLFFRMVLVYPLNGKDKYHLRVGRRC